MKKRRITIIIITCIALWAIGSFIKSNLPVRFPEIDRKPKPADTALKTLEVMPKYDPNSYDFNQVDLLSCDLSKLDLRNSENDLMHSIFDTTTIWPSKGYLPKNVDPEKIMELGINPGLGIRKLHRQGITGRGVGIAIIDNPLLVDHKEYVDQLRFYEEDLEILDCIPLKSKAHMHGPGVTSIAVGKNVGVAPEADLYYIARWVSDTGAIGIIKGLEDQKAQISLKRGCSSYLSNLENKQTTS